MKNILSLLLALIGLAPIYAQSTFQGIVKDGTNGEALMGAKITLVGTEKRCISDANGVYTLNGITKGKYTLVVKASSFNVYQLVDFPIGDAETKTLDIAMEPADVVKGPVVVTRKVKKDGNIELLRVQFNNEVVSNGISGEDIRKAPDSKVSDVLKRISGARLCPKDKWGGVKLTVVGERTIDVHIRKLREKLGESYIRTIKGVGYTFNQA
ncbi:MAG: carboxypeptidase regulatory-like domain-containing protein [Bacteroidota bacterium]